MPRKAKTDGDHYYDPFPQRLRSLMEERGLTQEDLVPILKVKTRQSVTGYIDGSTSPTGDKVAALASFFGVSSDYLLGLQKDPTNETEMKAVCEFTGLSSQAIEGLLFLKGVDGYSDLLSELISCGKLWDLLTNLMIIKQEIKSLNLFVENCTDYESFTDAEITDFNAIMNDLAVKVNIRLPNLVKDVPVKLFGYDPEMQDRINVKLAEIQLRKGEAKNGKQHIENN